MNIAIVDDNKSDRLLLEQTLKQYDSINQLGMQIHGFSSGESLLREYQPFEYTVVFLDIYMDGISGIETADEIRAVDEDTAIIFLTTSEFHHADAFSVFATAYLSKPFLEDEVFRVLDHILRLRTEKDKRFSFSYERRSYSLRYKDIVSMESDGNYLLINDNQGKTYRTRMTFSNAEATMDSRFLTLMKGILVNMDYIDQIQDSMCIMKNGNTFPVRVKDGKELKQKWLNYKITVIRQETALTGVKTDA